MCTPVHSEHTLCNTCMQTYIHTYIHVIKHGNLTTTAAPISVTVGWGNIGLVSKYAQWLVEERSYIRSALLLWHEALFVYDSMPKTSRSWLVASACHAHSTTGKCMYVYSYFRLECVLHDSSDTLVVTYMSPSLLQLHISIIQAIYSKFCIHTCPMFSWIILLGIVLTINTVRCIQIDT